MPKICSAAGCKNRFKRRADRGENEDRITYHRFPGRDLSRLEKWIDAVRRKDLTLERVATGNYHLCSKHFVEDDFLPYGDKKRLQDFAVPSVFSTHCVRKSRNERQKGISCAAYNCVYNTLRTRKRKKDIPLHAVPKDPVRKRQWAIAIRRKAEDGGLWIPWNGAALCSLHFPEEDFDRTGQTVRLREGATPSLFDYATADTENTDERGKIRLLSEEELKNILDGVHQPATTKKSSQPLISSDPSSRPVGRKLIGLRRLSTKYGFLGRKVGKTRSLKARLPAQGDHQYSHLRSNLRPSSPADDPEEAERDTSPEPLTAPEPLKLRSGRLTQHLAGMKRKQHQLRHLERTYHGLLDKVQFRESHPDRRSEKKEESALNAPLLTLRYERNEPALVPIATLSDDTLLPLTPSEAWKVVSALREQVLDLQLALMNSRIQVLDGELRLQEAKTAYKCYKVDAQLTQKATIREVEKRAHGPCAVCPELRRKLAVTERNANKKIRRSEALNKRLEEIFTPMQIRVLRTGKKGRWQEEDIRRALKLKMYVSHRGYSYIRNSMRIPMPSAFILFRGVGQYESLRPLYDAMVAENKKKMPGKEKKKVPKSGKNGRSMAAKKRGMDEVPEITNVESLAAERPLVKRRKKRSLTQRHPPRQAHGWGADFASYEGDAHPDYVETYASATSSYRSHLVVKREAGEERRAYSVQPSGVPHMRAWEMDDEDVKDDDALGEIARLQ